MLQKVTEGEGQGRGENKDARLCRHGGGRGFDLHSQSSSFQQKVTWISLPRRL